MTFYDFARCHYGRPDLTGSVARLLTRDDSEAAEDDGSIDADLLADRLSQNVVSSSREDLLAGIRTLVAEYTAYMELDR